MWRNSVTIQRCFRIGRATSASFLLLLLAGCSVVGTGHRVVVRAECQDPSDGSGSCRYITERYPNLIAKQANDRVLLVDANGSPSKSSIDERTKAHEIFKDYMKNKYGAVDFWGARLNASFYDRNLTPPFLALDTSTAYATLLGAALPTKKYTVDEIVRMRQIIEAQLRNVPDQQQITVEHDRNSGGQPRYFYYPRIALDFSVQFPSTSSYDRISYLAMVMALKKVCTASSECIRIKNFAPKAAELVEFSRGKFTQTAQAQLQAAATVSNSQTETTGASPSPVVAATDGYSVGPSATASWLEAYEDTLSDTVERRASGFLDEQTVFSEFRSIRNVRLAGTYTYDFQLEVPTTIDDHGVSNPVDKKVAADIYLIGVVRHVYKRGHKGLITKVPESENDDVYEQVLLKIYPNVILWQAPIGGYRPKRTCTVRVVTNRDDAAFVVKDILTGQETEGTGKVLVATLDEQGAAGTCKASVEFLPIPLGSKPNETIMLKAPPQGPIELKVGDSRTVMGKYEF